MEMDVFVHIPEGGSISLHDLANAVGIVPAFLGEMERDSHVSRQMISLTHCRAHTSNPDCDWLSRPDCS